MTEDGVRVERETDAAVIYLEGMLDRVRVPGLWTRIAETLGRIEAGRVIVDCREVEGVDSAGVALLRLLGRECDRRRLAWSRRELPEQAEEFLRYAEERSERNREEEAGPEPGLVGRIGIRTGEILATAGGAVAFLGLFLLAAAGSLRRGHGLPVREILYQLQKVGADAVPFVFLLSGLMGFIIGMQSVASTTVLSLGIHVADAVTLGTMKEMAPLLTAVIIAGHSGAAFAAEIGTMKVKEELSALEVMGFDPMRTLVLPRVLALAIAGPLLTMIADAAGIVGGVVQGWMIVGLSPLNYVNEVGQVLEASFLYEGLVKGLAFSLIIGLNGCFHGLRTGAAAESVGTQTTVTVVSGIFFIVILDALLAGIFLTFNV